MVYAMSPKILSFFDLVVKKPVTDLATSIEAFCLSGIDGESVWSTCLIYILTDPFLGVIGKLVKYDSQLRGDMVSLINSKLCMSVSLLSTEYQVLSMLLNDSPGNISKQQVNQMIYKNFDENITRKHGIVIDGWPLHAFDNPSSIRSQVELKVLLNAWQTGTMWFRKMTVEEHMAWLEEHTKPGLPCAQAAYLPPVPSQPPPPAQHNDQSLGQATGPPASHGAFGTLHFKSPVTLPSANTMHGAPKKSQKV